MDTIKSILFFTLSVILLIVLTLSPLIVTFAGVVIAYRWFFRH
jgi:hypothetical protein